MKIITEKPNNQISRKDAIEYLERGCIIAMTKGDGEVYFLEREMKDGLEYIYFQQLLGRTVSMLQTSRSFYDIKSMRLRCMTEAMKSGYELKLFETKKEFFQWCAEQVR